jgi:predicted RNA-binding protein with PUA-like domain
MACWLFKSEAETWSWDDQVAKGDAGQEWDGVRNYQARNNMRAMKVGDLGFFYHSQGEKAVVGIVEVIAEAHPDSTSDDARWECVDVRAIRRCRGP